MDDRKIVERIESILRYSMSRELSDTLLDEKSMLERLHNARVGKAELRRLLTELGFVRLGSFNLYGPGRGRSYWTRNPARFCGLGTLKPIRERLVEYVFVTDPPDYSQDELVRELFRDKPLFQVER